MAKSLKHSTPLTKVRRENRAGDRHRRRLGHGPSGSHQEIEQAAPGISAAAAEVEKIMKEKAKVVALPVRPAKGKAAASAPPAAAAGPDEAADAPSPAALLELERELDLARRRDRKTEAGAGGDHLASYFRDLSEHDLLDPEQEREIAQGIEDQEILTWERLLGNPQMVDHIASVLEARLDNSLKIFGELRRAAAVSRTRVQAPAPGKAKVPSTKGKDKDKLRQIARATAEQLRALDLDRTHVDAVLQDLGRLRDHAVREGKRHVASTQAFASYLEQVEAAYRGGAQLRNEFVRANLRLVVTMARRYDRGGMPLADLIQEGNLGLMHAVNRFDYRRGLRFSTYACWWIRHAIGRALADKARAVRIPVHMLEAQQQLNKVQQQLIGELGREPTPSELAKAARVPMAKLNQMHRYLMGQPMSLDRPVHEDDDRALGELLADPTTEEASPAESMTTRKLAKRVGELLGHLSPIEADVLRQRFGLVDDEERTFREIGDQYHLSRERIRQIQNSALDKLKRALEREAR